LKKQFALVRVLAMSLILMGMLTLTSFDGFSNVGADINTGLVGYWKFDEGSGITAYDSSGNNNDGTLVNGPSWVNGRVGEALSFDGVNDYIVVSHSPSLNITGTTLTLAAWVRPNSFIGGPGGYPQFVLKGDFLASYFLGLTNDGMGFLRGGDGVPGMGRVIITDDALKLNTWNHVAMTFDGTSFIFYINGVHVHNGSHSGNISSVIENLHIGGQPVYSNYFNGTIDEVRIYSRALSEEEIRELAQVEVVDWWPMFRHDLSHTGYSTSTAPYTNNTIWNYTTGAEVDSSPAVADGKVYVGSYDYNVYAFNATTGDVIWNYTTGDNVWSSPAVADGKVYVGSLLGPDVISKVYCLNASTGTHIWNYTTGDHVYSSCAVADGKVYVGSHDSNVYCLNASTGAKIWSYKTGSGVRSSPAVAEGKVYVGSHDHNVYCLNASTGAKIWSYTTGSAVYSSPAVAEGKVYVGSHQTDSNVYCLNASTGAKIWSYKTGSGVDSSPAVVDGRVYVGSIDHNVYCLSASTGAFIWSYTTGSYVDSSPAVANGKVYVGSHDGKVYCLSASTGAKIWSYKTGYRVHSCPAVANGKVYVGSHDGKVYAFGSSVGGIWVPIDKFALLAPYIALASTIIVATVATTICVKRVKRRKKHS